MRVKGRPKGSNHTVIGLLKKSKLSMKTQAKPFFKKSNKDKEKGMNHHLSEQKLFYFFIFGQKMWKIFLVFSASTYHSLLIYGMQHQHCVPYSGIRF